MNAAAPDKANLLRAAALLLALDGILAHGAAGTGLTPDVCELLRARGVGRVLDALALVVESVPAPAGQVSSAARNRSGGQLTDAVH